MNLKATEKLLKLLRSHGVEHFKSLEVEVKFAGDGQVLNLNVPHGTDTTHSVPTTTGSGASIPPVQMEIPHHVNEVQRLVKLSPDELVEEMFPLPKDETKW